MTLVIRRTHGLWRIRPTDLYSSTTMRLTFLLLCEMSCYWMYSHSLLPVWYAVYNWIEMTTYTSVVWIGGMTCSSICLEWKSKLFTLYHTQLETAVGEVAYIAHVVNNLWFAYCCFELIVSCHFTSLPKPFCFASRWPFLIFSNKTNRSVSEAALLARNKHTVITSSVYPH